MSTIADGGIDLSALVEDRPDEQLFRYQRTALTSGEVMETELERIFNRCWLYVGHESEVPRPGDYKRRKVGGRNLFFIRSRKSDAIHVFHNACTHRGAVICRHDDGNAKALQCFYHAWTFDTEGSLVGIPDDKAYGALWRKDEHGLSRPAQVDSYRGFIFVNFDPDAAGLIDYLAGAREYLDTIIDTAEEAVRFYAGADSDPRGLEVMRGTHIYGIRGNWKLLAENSYDGYHVAPAHASYLEYLKDMGQPVGKPLDGTQIALGNGHAVVESTWPWGRPVAKWDPVFGEGAKDEMERLRKHIIDRHGAERGRKMTEYDRLLVLFPNLVVNDIMSLVVRTFCPVRPGYMEVLQWEMAPAGERADVRARRLDSFLTFLGPGGFASPEDTEAVESVQQGAESEPTAWSYLCRGFEHERPTTTDEHQLRTWWREWHRRMTEER